MEITIIIPYPIQSLIHANLQLIIIPAYEQHALPIVYVDRTEPVILGKKDVGMRTGYALFGQWAIVNRYVVQVDS
jgi:hypothetical protein